MLEDPFKDVLQVALLVLTLTLLLTALYNPKFLGQWLREVDNARYENVVDQ